MSHAQIFCMVKERGPTNLGNVHENPDRLDRTLRLLASRERREILGHFITNETDVASVEVLSRKLARLAADADDEDPSSTEVAKVELHHVHLPKLAECDLVEYDARSGTVRYHADERTEAIVEFLAEL